MPEHATSEAKGEHVNTGIPAKSWKDAMRLAAELFSGITDKGGRPYVDHCIRIAVEVMPDAPDDVVCAALLHDVIEDIPGWNGDRLRGLGYSERTVSLVEALSRPAEMTYMDWIRQIAASGDEWLIRIKLADNLDNMATDRIAALPEAERGIVQRYVRARKILEAALLKPAKLPAVSGLGAMGVM